MCAEEINISRQIFNLIDKQTLRKPALITRRRTIDKPSEKRPATPRAAAAAALVGVSGGDGVATSTPLVGRRPSVRRQSVGRSARVRVGAVQAARIFVSGDRDARSEVEGAQVWTDWSVGGEEGRYQRPPRVRSRVYILAAAAKYSLWSRAAASTAYNL